MHCSRLKSSGRGGDGPIRGEIQPTCLLCDNISTINFFLSLHVLFSGGKCQVICLYACVLMTVTVFRCYGCADMQSFPTCVQECWELLSSEPFFILLSNLTGLSLHYLCINEDESEDGKSETENRDGEENTQAGGSSADADASSAEKKDKGDQRVHVLFLQRSIFTSTVYCKSVLYSCRTAYLCRRTASLGTWGLYIVT